MPMMFIAREFSRAMFQRSTEVPPFPREFAVEVHESRLLCRLLWSQFFHLARRTPSYFFKWKRRCSEVLKEELGEHQLMLPKVSVPRTWAAYAANLPFPSGLVLSCIEADVCKQIVNGKYSFESSRRDLHNALLCTVPKSHFVQKISRY